MIKRYNPFSDWRHLCALVVMLICLNVTLAFMQWPALVKFSVALLGPGVGATVITRQFHIRHGTWHPLPWPKWLIKR